ncbi:MAG TPA: HSP18 transcriptional regulator, partial [Actinophytocola sp.]|nr:HSP18 transcriptional regulator [Actinophytocola sp.]
RVKRAGDKAVAAWARRNATTLRQLAGQVSMLDDLGDTGRTSATNLGAALGTDDPADLLDPLAATRPHLTGPHPGIAEQVTEIGERSDQVRRNAINTRRQTYDERR